MSDPPALATAAVKISVVVPVFDPGRDLDRCIASLLDQSLPPEAYEVLFVDDGSTDGTGARLDALAANQPHIDVIHIEPSGWPGRPRNVGVAAATGEFVLFLDQDDHLGREALERLSTTGVRNRSDVVIGKVTSDFRAVPFELFRRDRDQCTVADAPLVSSMTAHKAFRRSFLLEHAIRFPEGRFVLEDHLFMVHVYARAERIAVVASYPCYFYNRRRDGTNTGSNIVDPAEYYRQMGKVVDAAMADSVPAELRGQFRRRYHKEMLGRLGDPLIAQDPALQQRTFDAIRSLDETRFQDIDPGGLPPVPRIRATLLREGDLGRVRDFADRTARLTFDCRLTGSQWVDGKLRLTLAGRFLHGEDGAPLVVRRHDGGGSLDPALWSGLIPDRGAVIDERGSFKARASVVDQATSIEWSVTTRSRTRDETVRDDGAGSVDVAPTFEIVVVLDPASTAIGGPLTPGRWVVRIRATGVGVDRQVDVRADDGRLDPTGPWLFGDPLHRVILDTGHALALEVVPVDEARTMFTEGPLTLAPSGRRSVAVTLPFGAGASARLPAISLLMRGTHAERLLPCHVDTTRGRVVASSRLGLLRERLPRGSYRVSLRLDDDGPDLPVGRVEVGLTGQTSVRGGGRRTALRKLARRGLTVLPPGLSTRLRRLARRANERRTPR